MFKNLLAISATLVLGVCVMAQQGKGQKQAAPVLDEWNDVEIFEQNKMYPRVNVVPYANENGIEKNAYKESPYYVSLNGKWHLHVSKDFSQRPTDVEQKGFNGNDWPEVNVPAPRIHSGSDVVKAPAIKGNAAIPAAKNPVATYYREIEVPKSWKDRKAVLNIQAQSAYYIWINHEYVGYSEDSRDRSEFEIGKHLQYGKTNSITVQVVGCSDGAFLESNATKTLNGITSDIYITLAPMVNIADFDVRADYDAASRNGSLAVNIDVSNAYKKGQCYVEMEIWNPEGRQVEKMGRWMVFDKKESVHMALERDLAKVEPWTAETPNLYTLVLRLRNEKMQLVEVTGTRFGFRTVEMKGGLLCVNGKAVTVRGVKYAPYSEKNGVQLSDDEIKHALQQMKSHNVNAVRTMLYSPANSRFYEICDEYGLYVFCDANLQPYSSQSKAVATDKNYINLFVSRVQNMYERLKNHPSVIAWSLGETDDNGVCMENAYRALKQKDKSRVIMFPGAGYSDNTDFVSPKRSDYDDLKLFAAKSQPRPLIMADFGCAQGNNFGNLEPMWNLVRKNSSLQGGFANTWNSVPYYNVSTSSEMYTAGFEGRNGIMVPYIEELKNLFRPFEVQMVNISPDAAEFNVTNYLDFLTLNDYVLEYEIFSNLKSRIIAGEVSVALKPGESKNFKLKIPALTLYSGEELFIRFVTRQRKNTEAVAKGTILGVKEFPLPKKGVKKELLTNIDNEPLHAVHTSVMYGEEQVNQQPATANDGVVRVYNDNIELEYDLDNAEITSYIFHGRQMLLTSPRINFWRAATDNDKVDKNAMKLWQNLAPERIKRTVVATNFRRIDEGTVGIDAMLRYADDGGAAYFDVKQSMIVLYTGDVLIDNELVASELVKTLPKLGVQMCLPKSLDTVRWFGMDNETYSDRRSSGLASTYKKAAKDLFFRYERPQEGGNRTNIRWLSVQDGAVGMYVDMMDTNFNFSIYPYTDHQLSTNMSGESLSEREFWTLNADYRQAAIGSALAGTDVADNDLINAKKYFFRVHLRAYELDEYSPYDFCRVEYPKIESSVLPMPVISKDRERFDGPLTISISTSVPKAEIRYTLDGSTPTETSMLYKKPFVIKNSTYVKAKAFKQGSTPSFTNVQRFNYDYVVSASFANKPNTPYNFEQETALFDAEKGDISELSRGWLGFSGNDLDVVLELSKAIELQDVVVNFAHVPDAWAFAPTSVTVYVSEDGVDYSSAIKARIKYAPEEESMNSPQLQKVTVEVNRTGVKYVRLVAKNMGRIPSWHKAKGLRPWIMVDEIQLNELIH